MLNGKILMGVFLISLFTLLIITPVRETEGTYFPYGPGVPNGGIVKGSTVRLSWKTPNLSQRSLGIFFKETFPVSPRGTLNINISGKIPIDCPIYEIYFGENPEPPYYKSIECDNEIIIENLKINRFYYWQIVVNDKNNKYPGPIWHFFTN